MGLRIRETEVVPRKAPFALERGLVVLAAVQSILEFSQEGGESIVGDELPKTYDFWTVEQRLYPWWESKGYFTPHIDPQKKPFVIIMPPPNVTGELHLGHALTATLEDIMIRWHRMRGEPTLWLPGSDHASIAVHYVIEKGLAERDPVIMELLEMIDVPLPAGDRRLTRHDLGREGFLKLAWAWKEKYGGIITQQHRRLGASCDWTRERFTMDPGPSRAVRTAFLRLFEKGWIYRGKRIIHWCPQDQTSLSDLEVEHEEEMGKLWHVRYPLEGGGYIQVATTRPETILGDTAVAVHPDDDRHKDRLGRIAILPVLNRRIPIIADEAVDPTFGTGAVKVTPGHDPDDWEIGQRHELPIINIMNLDATLNQEAGPYAGLDRFQARERLLADLQREGLLVKVEDHRHAPGRCYRCRSLVEPLVSEQWFVKIKPLAEPAIQAVREGRMRIVPERFTKVYYNWMENIRDWVISRQLWWGHRIPVWTCDNGHRIAYLEAARVCQECGSSRLEQDPDVLDTWFSSGLWPFSTLGWPEETEDWRYFYPTSVLETGYDILFFWVARMIMLGIECAGDIPFHTVYLHGMVRDEKGERMSKTKGNVINPLEVMEKYGTDALRFALVTAGTPGMDLKLSWQRVEDGRNFANKIWNMARFIISNLPPGYEPPDSDPQPQALYDRWILSRHNRLIGEVKRLLDRFQFGEAGRQIQEFLWGEFADWYIEASKTPLYGEDPAAKARTLDVLVHVFERTLRLLHPFMPFVTEEIWQHLPRAAARGEALIVARWPEPGPLDEKAERLQSMIWEHVRAIRNWRAEGGIEVHVRPRAYTSAGPSYSELRVQGEAFARLAHIELGGLAPGPEANWPQGPTVISGELSTVLVVEIDRDKERARLEGELNRLEREIARSEAMLSKRDFVGKAPPAVVQREREKIARRRAERDRLAEKLRGLG
ncbi:MAG: valine--tRNA ligase [Chloroflexi bacterium]|nr:valine--tRNA ligase [Chloroflexota bacterium]